MGLRGTTPAHLSHCFAPPRPGTATQRSTSGVRTSNLRSWTPRISVERLRVVDRAARPTEPASGSSPASPGAAAGRVAKVTTTKTATAERCSRVGALAVRVTKPTVAKSARAASVRAAKVRTKASVELRQGCAGPLVARKGQATPQPQRRRLQFAGRPSKPTSSSPRHQFRCRRPPCRPTAPPCLQRLPCHPRRLGHDGLLQPALGR